MKMWDFFTFEEGATRSVCRFDRWSCAFLSPSARGDDGVFDSGDRLANIAHRGDPIDFSDGGGGVLGDEPIRLKLQYRSIVAESLGEEEVVPVRVPGLQEAVKLRPGVPALSDTRMADRCYMGGGHRRDRQ